MSRFLLYNRFLSHEPLRHQLCMILFMFFFWFSNVPETHSILYLNFPTCFLEWLQWRQMLTWELNQIKNCTFYWEAEFSLPTGGGSEWIILFLPSTGCFQWSKIDLLTSHYFDEFCKLHFSFVHKHKSLCYVATGCGDALNLKFFQCLVCLKEFPHCVPPYSEAVTSDKTQ